MSSHRQGSENGAVDATEESVRRIETSSTGGKVEESSNSSEETEKDEKSSTAGGRKFPIIPVKLPGWTIWAIGSLILLAIPFHKGIIKFDGRLGRVIGAVIDEVQAVAPIVKKIAGGIADSLPEDCKLAQDLEFIENLAEEAEETADKAEDFIEKVEVLEDIRDVIEDVTELVEEIEPLVEDVFELLEVFEPHMEKSHNNNSKTKSR